MELYTVKLSLFITHCRTRALICVADDLKACGDFFYVIGVAHPHGAFLGNALKKRTILYIYGSFSVFAAVLGRGNDTSRHMCHQLISVADTKDRYSDIQNGRIIVRRFLVIYAVGTAREDDSLVSDSLDFPHCDLMIRLDFSIYVMLSHTAGNQLVILSTEVQNKYLFHTHLKD